MASMPVIRGLVRSLDPDLAVYDIATMEQIMESATERERFLKVLFSLLTALVVVLAGIGIYASMEQQVVYRTSEMGIRMALGANARDVSALVIKRCVVLLGLGLVVGGVSSIWIVRLMRATIYDLEGSGALVFGGSAALIVAIGLFSCLVPVRNAVSIQPAEALRGK